jgi:hypothetical protein
MTATLAKLDTLGSLITYATVANDAWRARCGSFNRCPEMLSAVDQAHSVRRIFMQHGHACIVEELWSNDTFGQQRMSLDEGTAD